MQHKWTVLQQDGPDRLGFLLIRWRDTVAGARMRRSSKGDSQLQVGILRMAYSCMACTAYRFTPLAHPRSLQSRRTRVGPHHTAVSPLRSGLTHTPSCSFLLLSALNHAHVALQTARRDGQVGPESLQEG